MKELDPDDKGSRGDKRHSFGGMSSTNSQLHRPEFRELVDVPAVTEVLKAYYGSLDFAVIAGGGDINMAGSRQHQPLHSDISRSALLGPSTAAGQSEKAPFIAVNYMLHDQTPFNGPLQHIAGTQHLDLRYLPKVEEEPEHWFYSTMCPAPAGTAVIRDVRAWHAGTPNLTTQDRPLPNCEFVAPFVAQDKDLMDRHRVSKPDGKQIPHEVWEALPERARHLTRLVKGDPGQPVEPSLRFQATGLLSYDAPLFHRLL